MYITFLERAQGQHNKTTKLEFRVRHSAPRTPRTRAKKAKSRNRQKAAQTKEEVGGKVSKKQAKRARYAKLHSDWRERQSETAKEVIRGTWGEDSNNLPLDKLIPFWKTLFESPSLEDSRTPPRAYPLKLALLDVVSARSHQSTAQSQKRGSRPRPY